MIEFKKIVWDQSTYDNKTVVLWGCRDWGAGMLHRFEKMSITVDYCCDNDYSKWGTEFYGMKVLSPKELEKLYKEKPDKPILVQLAVLEKNEKDIIAQLSDMGITEVLLTIETLKGCENRLRELFLLSYPDLPEDVKKIGM